MTTVLYPGSFDPVHNGHVEIVQTASGLFDHVVVAAMRNPSKTNPFLTLEERQAVLEETFAPLGNVSITSFSSLVVDLAQEVEADFIVKGLRAVSDFETELQMAQMNKEISGVHTLFIPSASERSFLASRLIREVYKFGGDVSSMVPEPALRTMREKGAPS
jgi:pantetheine-phosphate adenylyltransferase